MICEHCGGPAGRLLLPAAKRMLLEAHDVLCLECEEDQAQLVDRRELRDPHEVFGREWRPLLGRPPA